MDVGAIGIGAEISRLALGLGGEDGVPPKSPYTAMDKGRVAVQPFVILDVTDSTLEIHESGTVKRKW